MCIRDSSDVFDPIGGCHRIWTSWIEKVQTVVPCNWAPGEAGNSSGYRYSRKLPHILRRGGRPISSIIGANAHANERTERYLFNGLQIQLQNNGLPFAMRDSFFWGCKHIFLCFQVSFCPVRWGNRVGSSRNERDYSTLGEVRVPRTVFRFSRVAVVRILYLVLFKWLVFQFSW